jgi:hypothetical protein
LPLLWEGVYGRTGLVLAREFAQKGADLAI